MERRSAPSPSRWVAKLWRSACGETGGAVAISRRASRRRTARGPRGARRGEEQRRAGSRGGGGRQSGRPMDGTLVGPQSFRRLGPPGERCNLFGLCPAGAGRSSRGSPVDFDVARVEPTGFRNAQARAVDDLEQRPFEGQAPAGGVGVGTGSVTIEKPAHLVFAEKGREPLGPLGRPKGRHRAGRVARRRRTASERTPASTRAFFRWSRRRSVHGATQGRSGKR